MVDWKNRIVETADMAVKDLKANPKNWRKHPQAQQNALAGVLDAVGWVAPVIFNRQTGHLIDGHLRLELAVKRKEKTLPVSVVDLSPDEEAMILATFDPIAAMAEADRQMLAGLMQSIETEDEQVRTLLESIAREEKIDLGGEEGSAGPRPSLADRFVVPPFSVLDARQGYWQERKRAWLALGIKSELGRGENLTISGEQCTTENLNYHRNRAKPSPAGRPGPRPIIPRARRAATGTGGR